MDENDYRDFCEDIDNATSKSELKEVLIDWRDYMTGEGEDDDNDDNDGGRQYTLR